jgi:hypothetical protein
MRIIQPLIILSFSIPETEKTGTDVNLADTWFHSLESQAMLPEVSHDVPHDHQESAGNTFRNIS